jgi:hypothetical protein
LRELIAEIFPARSHQRFPFFVEFVVPAVKKLGGKRSLKAYYSLFALAETRRIV